MKANNLVQLLRAAEVGVKHYIHKDARFTQLPESEQNNWCLFAQVLGEQLKFHRLEANP
jgi:hypothetical protein